MFHSIISARASRRLPTLSASIAAAFLIPWGGAYAESLSFDAAITLAESDAPALIANAARVNGARAAAVSAGSLPDPNLTLGLDNLLVEGADRFTFAGDSMTMQRIGIAQTFPSQSKLNARVDAARGRVDLAEAQSHVTRLNLVRDTATTWIARQSIEKQMARLDGLAEENTLLKAAVVARVTAGKASATETLSPRLEAAMLDERRDELRAQRAQLIATLRRIIGPAADFPLAGSAPEWEITGQALHHALHQHPDIAVFEPQGRILSADIAEAEAAKKLDWTLGFTYENRATAYGDMLSIQVSFDLPFFPGTRQNPHIQAKRAEQSAIVAEREQMLREHAWNLETELARYERLTQAAKRQREIFLPLANEKVALTLAAWRGTQTSLTELVNARRERIDAELKTLTLEGERQQLAASLHYGYGTFTGEQP